MARGARLVAVVAAAVSTAACAHAASPPPSAAALFLSPTGTDAASCTASAPCASLQRAFALAQPGQVVELAAGTYPGQSLQPVAKPGAAHVVFRPAAGATVSFAGRLSLDGVAHVTLQGFRLARPGVGDRSL